MLLQPQRDSLSIRLTNADSDVRELRVDFAHPDFENEYLFGLHQVPSIFVYRPQSVESKPWIRQSVPDPEAFPRVLLTNEDDCPLSEQDWKDRDVLWGFGSVEGTARLAELFLDMSREGNEVSEFVLESEAGFRGVAPASAEIRFWLPGGDVPDTMFPQRESQAMDAP